MELVQYKGAAVERDIQHPALKKVLEFLPVSYTHLTLPTT